MYNKREFRVYREAQITDENEILDPVLKGSFANEGDAHKLVKELVKEDSDEFAHEYYYAALYEYKVFTNEGAKDWFFNEAFGKRFTMPKTARGILNRRNDV